MITQETLRRVQQALASQGIGWDMAKAAMTQMQKATFAAPGSTTTGLNFYNLEPIAKRLFNSYTPIRNETPRRPGPGGTAANWRAITGINAGKMPMGVPDGVRAAALAHTVTEYTAKYVEIGSESSTTFLAQLAAQGFDDVRAIQAITGLRATQNREEQYLIAGLGTFGLGTAPTVTIADSLTAGSLSTSTTYHVRVVALSAEGLNLSVAPTATVPGQLAMVLTLTSASPRATTYTVNGGASQISADASHATGGSTTAVDVSCAAVPGAAAYAWFLGSSSTNGTCVAITTVNIATLTTLKTAGAPPTYYADTVSTNFDADHSRNARVFDGILGIAAASGSGATITSLDGGKLNGDSAAGIVEIDALLRTMATSFKVSPETMWVNFQQIPDITSKVMSGGSGAQLYHIVMTEGAAQGSVMAGTRVTSYQNKFALDPAKQSLAVRVHPDIPPGTILFTSQQLPPISFPDANISGVLEVETLQEYTQMEWPLTDRQYESGVYVTSVLKCYFPPALGVLSCIGVG